MKTDISKEMKEAGFVFREPTEEQKKDPKYLKAIEMCKNAYSLDIKNFEPGGQNEKY